MNDEICKNCVHFRQHYVLDEQSAMTANCGHCVYPRIKHRQPRHTACAYFTCRTDNAELPDRENVIHFLTRDLLRHILDLALPPEIG